MSAIETKVFKSGNSAAVRLPKELGFEPGTTVRIEKTLQGLMVVPVVGSEEQRARNAALAERIRAAWAEVGGPPEPQLRDPDIFPYRPGLY